MSRSYLSGKSNIWWAKLVIAESPIFNDCRSYFSGKSNICWADYIIAEGPMIAQLVKAFTTGVNSELPTLPSFWGKMSLSLSNSLSFALIPLVKIGKNCKNSYFFVLEV